MSYKVRDLRRLAVASSLFPETTLQAAVKRLGFVQADPIRSPARAQDLILRHRVRDYRLGDLHANFQSLRLEEDFLYAYGFMPRSTWQLLHPRGSGELTPADQKVLAIVAAQKQLHPRDLHEHFGNVKEANSWGRSSKASTRSLERLHYRGFIRVSGREGSVKLYAKTSSLHKPRTSEERLRRLILLIARILAPISETSLRAALQHLRHAAPDLTGRAAELSRLIKTGELTVAKLDQVSYILPADETTAVEHEPMVRFLAPFDPLVWDRRRFEHLWGWAYRFEAYTPPQKRKMGYYALPLLWNDAVIGWVNILNNAGMYDIQPGFVAGHAPTGNVFRRAFEAEADRIQRFLVGHSCKDQ